MKELTMKNSKKTYRLPPFVAITWEMLNSKPFKELNFASAKALIYFLGKPKLRMDDANYYDSVFQFSYGEAEKLGFARETFSRCIKDLVAGGFLVKVSSGGLRGDSKSYSKYSLSPKWKMKAVAVALQVANYRIQSKNG
jgi:hypothetical protein